MNFKNINLMLETPTNRVDVLFGACFMKFPFQWYQNLRLQMTKEHGETKHLTFNEGKSVET